MTDKLELTHDELLAQDIEALPEREAMSLVNANAFIPVNAAVSLNALSDGSVSFAQATQDLGSVTQSN